MSSSFNSDFYITSAAAIPLFYLAAFVQEGNVITDTAELIKNGIASTRELAKNWLASMYNYLKDRHEPGIRGIAYKCWLITAFLIPFIIILLIPFILAAVGFLLLAAVFAGVLSEGISIWVLFYQSDNLPLREIVLWAMLGLLVVMSVKPAVQVMKDLPWSSIFSRAPETQAAPDVVGGCSGDASEDRVPIGVAFSSSGQSAGAGDRIHG